MFFKKKDKICKDEYINETCSICLDDFDNINNIKKTKCNHIFHKKCIKKWTSYKSKCPICRGKLKTTLKNKIKNKYRKIKIKIKFSFVILTLIILFPFYICILCCCRRPPEHMGEIEEYIIIDGEYYSSSQFI